MSRLCSAGWALGNHPATFLGGLSLAQRIVPHTQDREVSLFQEPFSELRMATMSPEAQLHPGAITLQAGPRHDQHFQKSGPSKKSKQDLQGRGPSSSHDPRCPSGRGSGLVWEGRAAFLPSLVPLGQGLSVGAPAGTASGRTGRAWPPWAPPGRQVLS